MSLTLRPYQQGAIDGLFAYWSAHAGNPLLVVPTGGGKSLIMATIMQRLVEEYPDLRIACVTHVKELIEQNYKELVGLWPWAPAGILSAGLGRKEMRAQILFCGVQTAANHTARIGHVDVLLVDEAHLIPRKSDTLYGRFIAELRAINPDMKIVGLTATAFRLDSGRLDEDTKKGDRLFDRIAYEIPIRDLINGGFLSPLVSKATATTFDVSGVHHRGGEFVAAELQAAVDRADITAQAVREMRQLGAGRRAWLAFCSGVEHAYHVRDELRRQGITADTVEGGMSAKDRDAAIGRFRAGYVQALTNANVLTTGFNVPHVDLVAMMRPTESAGLYIQMVGRGSRLASGKRDCLILDYAGNVRRHGPIDAIRPKKPGEGGGDAPVKICPACASIVHASVMECRDCGHQFESDPEPKVFGAAGNEPILSATKPEWVRVSRRTLALHEKPDRPPSVRVEYLCGLTSHREWVCPEHQGGARKRFEKFWRESGGHQPPPATVLATLARQRELDQPSHIMIRPSGRYFEVVGHRFTAAEAA